MSAERKPIFTYKLIWHAKQACYREMKNKLRKDASTKVITPLKFIENFLFFFFFLWLSCHAIDSQLLRLFIQFPEIYSLLQFKLISSMTGTIGA